MLHSLISISQSATTPLAFFTLQLTGSVAAPASKFVFGGARKIFRRGKKCKKKPTKRAKNMSFLCWNCQIWANFNTFEIILGANWGRGARKYFGGQISPCLPPPIATGQVPIILVVCMCTLSSIFSWLWHQCDLTVVCVCEFVRMLIHLFPVCNCTLWYSQTYTGHTRPPILSRVMASSAMGLQLRYSNICQLHTWKQTLTKCVHNFYAHAYISIACTAAFHKCLSSRSDRSRYRWHTHLTNQDYFDQQKSPNIPNWSPMSGGK